MIYCKSCGGIIADFHPLKIFCSVRCRNDAFNKRRQKSRSRAKQHLERKKCANCSKDFSTRYPFQIFCSKNCNLRVKNTLRVTKCMVDKTRDGTYSIDQSRRYKGNYTKHEVDLLRSSPLCVLPNRSLLGQWIKCERDGIARDESLRVKRIYSDKSITRRKILVKNEERIVRAKIRANMRSDPENFLKEVRVLAKGHRNFQDILEETFAIALRRGLKATEAFKLAKTEVNRTSAQPFREQSFNPEVDYEARETGRQVARASDIRAARGEG